MIDYDIHTFSNGFRLIYQRAKGTRVVHCGYIIDAGSRDELPEESGLAHFIEHMLFKGTKRRPATRILNRLEVVGGELNAFTTKDKTAVYASIVKEHSQRAIDLLSDIVFHSMFPEKEIEREKKVISEEIDMYLDTPEERIYDEFQEACFEGHALGTNILGDKAHLFNFNREMILQFMQRNYRAESMVFAFVGDIPMARIVQQLEKTLQGLHFEGKRPTRTHFSGIKTFREQREMPFVQSYAVLGFPAYTLEDERRTGLMLLNNILGGPGLNSRLNLSLREKNALTYSVDSSYLSFTDTGLLSIHWSADASNMPKTLKLVERELEAIRSKQLTDSQLKKYKTQFRGQVIMGEDNKASLMLLLGRSLLDLGRVDSLDEVLERINRVRAAEIQNIASELLHPDKQSRLLYFPEK